MARETKEDRTVRQIQDQVAEHLHQLKLLEANPNTKETEVETWCQSFLRSCLGFTAMNGYTIRSQETKGKSRPDLIVLKGEKPVFVVEVKKLGFDLQKSDFRSGRVQLNEYLKLIGDVRWGILSNGTEWRLYDFSQHTTSGVEVQSFDLKGESDLLDLNKKVVEEISYEILDFHETSCSANYWEELSLEALAFSPDSLAKSILSADVVKYIARSIKGEHEYRANHEVLMEKIFDLLQLGLNEAVSGWNDQKAAELQKYIKSQKKQCRKAKRSKKIDSAEMVGANATVTVTVETVQRPTAKDENAA